MDIGVTRQCNWTLLAQGIGSSWKLDEAGAQVFGNLELETGRLLGEDA